MFVCERVCVRVCVCLVLNILYSIESQSANMLKLQFGESSLEREDWSPWLHDVHLCHVTDVTMYPTSFRLE